MSDEIDIAQERAQIILDAALASRQTAPAASWNGEPRDCLECGEPIIAGRLMAVPAARACAQCQAELEGRR